MVDEVDNLRGLDPAVLFIGVFFCLVPKIRLVGVRYILDPWDLLSRYVVLVFCHVTTEHAVHPDNEIHVDRGADQGVVCHPDGAVEHAPDLRQPIRYRSRVHPRSF